MVGQSAARLWRALAAAGAAAACCAAASAEGPRVLSSASLDDCARPAGRFHGAGERGERLLFACGRDEAVHWLWISPPRGRLLFEPDRELLPGAEPREIETARFLGPQGGWMSFRHALLTAGAASSFAPLDLRGWRVSLIDNDGAAWAAALSPIPREAPPPDPTFNPSELWERLPAAPPRVASADPLAVVELDLFDREREALWTAPRDLVLSSIRYVGGEFPAPPAEVLVELPLAGGGHSAATLRGVLAAMDGEGTRTATRLHPEPGVLAIDIPLLAGESIRWRLADGFDGEFRARIELHEAPPDQPPPGRLLLHRGGAGVLAHGTPLAVEGAVLLRSRHAAALPLPPVELTPGCVVPAEALFAPFDQYAPESTSSLPLATDRVEGVEAAVFAPSSPIPAGDRFSGAPRWSEDCPPPLEAPEPTWFLRERGGSPLAPFVAAAPLFAAPEAPPSERGVAESVMLERKGPDAPGAFLLPQDFTGLPGDVLRVAIEAEGTTAAAAELRVEFTPAGPLEDAKLFDGDARGLRGTQGVQRFPVVLREGASVIDVPIGRNTGWGGDSPRELSLTVPGLPDRVRLLARSAELLREAPEADRRARVAWQPLLPDDVPGGFRAYPLPLRSLEGADLFRAARVDRAMPGTALTADWRPQFALEDCVVYAYGARHAPATDHKPRPWTPLLEFRAQGPGERIALEDEGFDSATRIAIRVGVSPRGARFRLLGGDLRPLAEFDTFGPQAGALGRIALIDLPEPNPGAALHFETLGPAPGAAGGCHVLLERVLVLERAGAPLARTRPEPPEEPGPRLPFALDPPPPPRRPY
ncbi:MAG: hypothetical protein SF028_09885 [Candidatus Sumerlaeia bacterium]|nr:hypothetical protein [Candidatus Sumerlaeia bacterium]